MTIVRNADEQGLTASEAAERLERDGPNVVQQPSSPRVLARLWHSLSDPLTAMLMGAGIISLLVFQKTSEAVAILAIVALNIAVETVQEARSDRAVQGLGRLTAPTARARRDGVIMIVPAERIVIGDVVVVEAGDRVPADLQLLEQASLGVDESILTGESLPVDKVVEVSGGDLGNRGSLFAGSMVVRGRGIGLVVAVGPRTALGAIASSLGKSPQTPLERDLRQASVRIMVIAAAVGSLMTTVGLMRGGMDRQSVLDAVLAGVALAIAAVPEGLVVTVTTALALGAQRMAGKGMIVRHLRAIEALGCTSVLCTDKTGTLTSGKLTVAASGATSDGEAELWSAVARCNDAEDGHGDPVDVALAEAARSHGVEAPGDRVATAPFDASTRMMTTVHRAGGRAVVSVKGAPEAVMARCAPGPEREEILASVPEMTAQGLRVLAVAGGIDGRLDAQGLRPLGLIGLHDPPRATASAAIAAARRAGIRVVMVTGDDPDTAKAIAERVGMGGVVAGGATPITEADVVARVQPAVKVELVEAHRAAGAVVAMIGDGVNDAPALRRADVGVAIAGEAGTDVAREASDLVVTSGDLGVIVAAVKEGRAVYRNLVSLISYLITGNLSEVLVVAVGIMVFPELAVTLLPVQLLWINLVTDGVPAIALGLDRSTVDPLESPPRPAKERLLSVERLRVLSLRAVVVALAVTVAGLLVKGTSDDGRLRTQLVVSLVFAHLLVALISRSERWSFERGWWRSPALIGAVGVSLGLQVVVVMVPTFRHALGLSSLPASGWLIAAGAGVVPLVLIDGVRLLRRARKSAP